MMKLIFLKLLISLITISILGCGQSDYTQLVKAELKKGVRSDSTFLGINLGDSRQLYRTKCTGLNKSGLLGMGSSGGVAHRFLLEPSDSTQMVEAVVLPNFDGEDKISHFSIEYSYVAWSPWNRRLQGDSLQPRLIKYMTQKYGGNGFMKVNSDNEDFWVKIDGNRRIVFSKPDAGKVLVKIHDLSHPFFKP